MKRNVAIEAITLTFSDGTWLVLSKNQVISVTISQHTDGHIELDLSLLVMAAEWHQRAGPAVIDAPSALLDAPKDSHA